MNEENDGTSLRFKRIEDDIVELKSNNKEMGKDMTAIKESHIETRIYMRQIQESQASQSKDSKDIMQAIQNMKDEPRSVWKQMSLTWKIGAGLAIISYIIGTIGGYVKMFVK